MATSTSAAPVVRRSGIEVGGSTLDRLSSFRITYVAIFAFLILYVGTIRGAEMLLDAHFRDQVARALRVSPENGPVMPQMQLGVRRLLRRSAWVRLGEVRVNAFVLGADGTTIYAGGPVVPPPSEADPMRDFMEAARLIPPRAEVVVSVPHSSFLAIGILVSYGTILLTGLFFYNRRVARQEIALVEAAVAARDASAGRANEIERELASVRHRLSEVVPAERAQTEEIRGLQQEREALMRKLGDLAEREGELRASAERSLDLEQERQALEELLEEATEDLSHKESEIHELQDTLKRAAKSAPKSSSKARAAEQMGRRLRTLYKNLEIDDRAVQDIVALRDETMKLKAEEGIKRLADEQENAGIRRKVGGLPPQLSIFELGFAGKGRLYYTRGSSKRHRILAVGAKNTQKTDLEYLSRLSL